MNLQIRKTRVLALDNNSSLWGEITQDLGAAPIEILRIESEDVAIQKLHTDGSRIQAVWINPELSHQQGLKLIRKVFEATPVAPIFVIHSRPLQATETQLEKVGVRKAIPLEKARETVTSILKKMVFDPEAAVAATKELSREKVGEESQVFRDSDFHSIRAADFLSGTRCLFDVFVRLKEDRYVKVLQAGDAFSQDRVMNYLQKGVTNFYILKEMQRNYIGYCDQLSQTLLDKANVPNAVVARQVANFGEEAAKFLSEQGVSEENLLAVKGFAVTTEQMLKRMGPEKNVFLLGFMKDLTTYEHSVGVTMVASLLLEPLGFERQKSVETVGLACLLHDIGLQKMPEKLKTEDEREFTDEDLKLYHTHPTVGAEMLREVKGLDSVVLMAVAQHHERRSGNGFPLKLGTGAIQKIAEVVGIADEFIRLMARLKKDPTLVLSKELERNIFNGFSFQVVEAFRKNVIPTSRNKA